MNKELYINLITALAGLTTGVIGLYATLVNSGVIKKFNRGKSRPFSISNKGLDLIKHFESKKKNEITIRHIETETDLKNLYKLDQEYYGDSNISYERLHEWWINNKKAISIAYSNDILFGALGIFPVTKKWINLFYNGKVGESSLDSNTIMRATLRTCSDWYISGIVVRKSSKRPFIVAKLLKESSTFWLLNGNICYPINLWAIAFSNEGENLLKKFDFHLERTKEQMLDNFPLYKRTLHKEEFEYFLKRDIMPLE